MIEKFLNISFLPIKPTFVKRKISKNSRSFRDNTNQRNNRNGEKMKDSFSWITPKQAGDLAEYSARHIQNMITSGKLSATKEDGKYYIEKSEFFRLFPRAHRNEKEGNNSHKGSEHSQLQLENGMLKEMSSQKDKEIEFLRSQIEYVSQEKIKMLDAIVSHTRILEHKQSSQMPLKKQGWKAIFTGKKD